MPSSLLALSERHRAAQDRVASALEERVRKEWARRITGPPTDSMRDAWIAAMIPFILAARTRSEALSRVHYQRARRLEFPNERSFSPPGGDRVEREALATSLLVTGVIGLVDRLKADMPLAEALSAAGTAAAGASARHALAGGRSSIINAVQADRVALGFYRNTREGCCYFCAALASRGVVYKEDSFVASDARFEDNPNDPSTAKVHDHCYCTLEPVYSRTAELPQRNEAFTTLWYDSTGSVSGEEKMRAFRRAYEKGLAA